MILAVMSLVIIGLLISNIYYISQYSNHKKLVEDSNEWTISRGANAFSLSILSLQNLIELLENDASKTEQLIAIGELSMLLDRTRLSFEQMNIYYRMTMPSNRVDSMGEFALFFVVIKSYIEHEIKAYVLEEETNRSYNDIKNNLESLYEGLKYMEGNLVKDKFFTPNDVLLEGKYNEVKVFWNDLIEEVVAKYPDNTIFERYYEREIRRNIDFKLNLPLLKNGIK